MSQVNEYKCPCCGGPVQFDPSSQNVKCPYCGTEFEPEVVADYSKESNESTGDSMDWTAEQRSFSAEEAAALNVFSCDSCGGEIIGDGTTAATTCPYCGSPVVVKGRVSDDLKPDRVLPFKVTKEAAVAALKQHVKKRMLLPKSFAADNHLEEIQGVYVPYWLYDGTSNGSVLFKGTRTRSWSDSRNRYVETKHYSIKRAGTLGFAHIPADGSSKMADDLMESLEPFDYNESVDFTTAYLAGYTANRYDVSAKEDEPRINERVRNTTIDEFRKTVHGYQSVTVDTASVRLTNAKVQYALYPMWLLNSKWEDKIYTFAMNGQSGKFVGDLPVDKKALAFWRIMLFLIGALVGGLISFAMAASGNMQPDATIPFLSQYWFVFMLALGLILCFVLTGIWKSKLRSVHAQRGAASYIVNGSMNISESYEHFLYSHVSAIPINRGKK